MNFFLFRVLGSWPKINNDKEFNARSYNYPFTYFTHILIFPPRHFYDNLQYAFQSGDNCPTNMTSSSQKRTNLSNFVEFCPKFVRFFPKFVRILFECCPNFVWFFSNFVRILSEFCPNVVRILSEFFPNCPKHKDPRPYKMLSTLSSQYVARKINIKQGTPIDVF